MPIVFTCGEATGLSLGGRLCDAQISVKSPSDAWPTAQEHMRGQHYSEWASNGARYAKAVRDTADRALSVSGGAGGLSII